MKKKGKLPKLLLLAVLGGTAVLAGHKYFASSPQGATVDVRVPQLSAQAMAGKAAYDANCAQCHGANAAGTGKGPPLVHKIYNPGHHSDIAFFYAAQRGVRQHHWPYGDMPAQLQVSDAQIGAIVTYVRELQAANGIIYERHGR